MNEAFDIERATMFRQVLRKLSPFVESHYDNWFAAGSQTLDGRQAAVIVESIAWHLLPKCELETREQVAVYLSFVPRLLRQHLGDELRIDEAAQSLKGLMAALEDSLLNRSLPDGVFNSAAQIAKPGRSLRRILEDSHKWTFTPAKPQKGKSQSWL